MAVLVGRGDVEGSSSMRRSRTSASWQSVWKCGVETHRAPVFDRRAPIDECPKQASTARELGRNEIRSSEPRQVWSAREGATNARASKGLEPLIG